MSNAMNQVTSLSQFTRLRQPLTIGDVVSVGLAIAKQRWSLFSGIALRSIAWLVIPLVGIIVGSGFLAVVANASSESQVSNVGAVVLLFVAWLVLSLFCFGKYLANAGLISRIAFNDLSQREETVRDASRVTRSRTWSYLGASFVYGIILLAALIGLGIVFSVIFAIFAVLITGITVGFSSGNVRNSSAMGVVGLLSAIVLLVLMLGYFTGLVWVMARFFFSEVPLSVESKIGAIGAIDRSWELSKRSGWRLMTITTVGFLVTLPITALGQLIVVLPILLLKLGDPSETSSAFATGLSSLLNLVATLLITLLTMGFWQSVKAVVYFDLLNCREGQALQIQDD